MTPATSSSPDSMSILEHLGELRSRLLKALLATILTTSLSFIFAGQFVEILAGPIGGLDQLQAVRVTENIGVFMRVALLSGVILAMPMIVYQLLMFIIPGLTRSEKKWVYLAVPTASLLFAAGVLFAFLVMLPAAVPFLVTGILPIETKPMVSDYIGFVTNLLFWIGISFETPLMVFILAKLGLVSARALLKQWRLAIVVIAVIAAVATPTPDPVNMGLLMLPLFVLYLLSVLMAFLARRGS